MARIKIKSKGKSIEEKRKLLAVLSRNNIYATNILDARDGFVVSINNQDEIDTLFETKCQEELQQEDFVSILPQDLK